MSEALSLVKTSQKSFSKKVNAVQQKLKTGTITVNEKVKGKYSRKRDVQQRGLVYLSHIPHGFYEEEMRSYFKQFGKVTNLKLCRSKKTGRSKGYAFIEFEHTEVAKIAAETMNNYLMFKKRLVAEYIPPEKQKRGAFSKNPITPTNVPHIIQREKEVAKKNENFSPMVNDLQTKKLLTQLENKLNRLKTLGINHELKPIGVCSQAIQEEDEIDSISDTDNSFYYEAVDSDIDVKITKQPKRKVKGKIQKNTAKKLTKTKNKQKVVVKEKRNIKSR